MSEEIDNLTEGIKDGVRSAFAISGLVAIVIGVLVLVWPGKTAMVVAAVLGVYAVISGLFYVGVGISVRRSNGWARVGHILLGVLYVIAGVVLFMNLGASVAILQIVIGIMIGAVWLVEGIMAFTTLGAAPSKGAAIFYGVVGIIAGLALLFAPALYVSLLWWMLGAFMVVLCFVQLYRAFTFDYLR